MGEDDLGEDLDDGVVVDGGNPDLVKEDVDVI